MIKTCRNDTREHILTVGEQLCLQSGFHATGLSELLKRAGVPKGSFYHYFPSKEAFGVAMLERFFAHYVKNMRSFFEAVEGEPVSGVLAYYRQSAEKWHQHSFAGCLSVKLSAEVCDLSEEMRQALNDGYAAVIATLSEVLEKAQQKRNLSSDQSAREMALMLHMLWTGASLHSKICRSPAPLLVALQEIERILRVN